MPIRRELIDELLKDAENPQGILGENGLLKELSKAVIERALQPNLTRNWEMSNMSAKAKPAATLAMDTVKKPSKANWVRWRSPCLGTGKRSLSLN